MLSGIAEVPGAAAWPASWDRFSESIDPRWVTEALEISSKASLRRRRLPAEQVVWLVIGMGMLRDRSIADVVDHLDLALSDRDGGAVVAPSAVSQARARLGAEPLRWLFEKTARCWGHRSADNDRWNGLALYGVDGTKLFAANTESNETEFGRFSTGEQTSAFPMVRLVALMALRSRMLVEVNVGSYSGESEVSMARSLWEQLPDHSLAIVDRGFLASPVLVPIAAGGTERHWLTRANSNTSYRELESLGDGDAIVEMTIDDKHTRERYPDLPKRWRMRAVRYHHPGYEPQTLLTSLLDVTKYPAEQLVALYHERWELELMFDDLKTTQLKKEPVLRSKSADGVKQELWGILIAHNLVRLEIERIATLADVAPRRISFTAALHFVCDEWAWASLVSAKPGAIPKHLRNLEEKIKRFVLPERRPTRVYPRAVNVARSRYPSKASVLRAQRKAAENKAETSK